jgi:hypothetical protein
MDWLTIFTLDTVRILHVSVVVVDLGLVEVVELVVWDSVVSNVEAVVEKVEVVDF